MGAIQHCPGATARSFRSAFTLGRCGPIPLRWATRCWRGSRTSTTGTACPTPSPTSGADTKGDQGTPISGATEGVYVLAPEDTGHRIGFRVSFTDDDGFPESLDSSLTPVVNDPAKGKPTISGDSGGRPDLDGGRLGRHRPERPPRRLHLPVVPPRRGRLDRNTRRHGEHLHPGLGRQGSPHHGPE